MLTLTTLVNVDGSPGNSHSNLTIDSAADLFGTTENGGANNASGPGQSGNRSCQLV
jgi:hypothetical protein